MELHGTPTSKALTKEQKPDKEREKEQSKRKKTLSGVRLRQEAREERVLRREKWLTESNAAKKASRKTNSVP